MEQTISLCVIKYNDRTGYYSLRRLADVKGEILEPVDYNSGKDKSSDKPLKYIYYNNYYGPTTEDMAGFWSWERFVTRDSSGEEKYKTQADYMENIRPIEILGLVDGRITEEVLEHTLTIPGYIEGKFLIANKREFQPKGQKHIRAVLLDLNDCQVIPVSGKNEKKILLKEDIYTLPVYELNLKDDSFAWKDYDNNNNVRYFLNRLNLGKSIRRMVARSPVTVMQKELEIWLRGQNISREDRRDFKNILQAVPQMSVMESLQDKYQISEEQAQRRVNTFIKKVRDYVDVTDQNAEMAATIIRYHEPLRAEAEAKIEKMWREANKSKIAEGEKVCRQLNEEKEKINKEIQVLQEKVKEQKAEYTQINQEITQYTELRDSIESETKRKIEDARQHMGRFLTEISAFTAVMPTGMSNHRAEGWSLKDGEKTTGKDISAVKSSSWEDVRETIGRNLEMAGVAPEWCDLAGSYLYAAYIHHMDLLLAGPHGRAIANALALAVEGKKAVCLSCHGEPDASVIQQLKEMQEPVIVVENPFHPEWLSRMGECKAACPDTLFIWLHPFTEDLVVEPLGLFNYVLPVFTEFFVNGDEKPEAMQRSLQSDAFEAYQEKKPVEIPLPLMKPFKISTLTRTHLKQLIATAAGIMDERTVAGKLEFLMGKLPFALLTNERRYDESECSGFRELRYLAKQYLEEAD